MDAPVWETFVRLAYALVATGVSVILVWSCLTLRRYYSARPLLWFLTGVVVANTLWRWYVLWVGLQHDADGSYGREWEPFIRTFGVALSLLLYIALGLMAFHHVRRAQGRT